MKPLIEISGQRSKAALFHKLHHEGKLLILPNIWDSLGAMLLQDLGYPAVATASASVAFANGYDDGENIPFDELLMILKKIILNVNIPVTVDMESGYAENDQQLKKNIQQLIETGISGINLEDTDKHTHSLLPIEKQCEKIRLIRNVCEEMDTQLVINARTDVYIHHKDNGNSTLEETIKRGFAYKAAGADCFYPIAMRNPDDISLTIKQLKMPVNILLTPGIPELPDLQNMGVSRVSLGPGFLKIAVQAMKNLAVKLQHYEGIDDITGNEITSAYLKDLVTKKEVDLNTCVVRFITN